MVQAVFQLQNANTIAPSEFDYLTSSSTVEDTLSHGAFNAFDVKNFSTERIKVRLDGSTDRAFVVEAGEGLATEADDEIVFAYLQIENLDSVNTVSANEIQVTFMRTI